MLSKPLPVPKGRTRAQAQRQRKKVLHENTAKVREEVFDRDGWQCRICGLCDGRLGYLLELAHLKAKGMGGDKRALRTTTANAVALCPAHHRGPRSLHSGHLTAQPLTPQGADGPLVWTLKERL